MCGLFGVLSSWLGDADRDLFKQLGLISAIRGLDSTGIMGAYKKDKKKHHVVYHKKAMSSGEYFSTQSKVLFDRPQPLFLAGHCRAATVGDVNDDNAHPFAVGKITGMHNGTINGFARLAEGLTDSAVLIERIAEGGVEEALKSVPMGGAYAIVYFDTSNGTINFIRNDMRTLFYVWNKDKNTMLWASEAAILELVTQRNQNKVYQWSDIMPFMTSTLYSIKVGENPPRMTYQKLDLTKKFISLVPSVPKKESDGPRYEYMDDDPARFRSSVVHLPRPGMGSQFTYDNLEFYPTLPGVQTSRAVLLDTLNSGCAWCSSPGQINEHKKIGWVTDLDFVCADCLDDKHNVDWLLEAFNHKIHINDPEFRNKVFNKEVKCG